MKAPQNKGLHQTGRGGVAIRLRRPVVEARPAGEARCYAGYRDRLVPDENEKDSASCVDD